METAITAISVFWCVAVLFFLYRMWEAHKLRIGIMKEDLDTYMKLPSYGVMVFKFWRPLSWFIERTVQDHSGETLNSRD